MVFTVRQNAILALAVLFMHGKWGQGVMAMCDLFLHSDKHSLKWKICLLSTQLCVQTHFNI